MRDTSKTTPVVDTRALNRRWTPATWGEAELAIMSATEQLLVETPLHLLKVEDIIRAANVTRTTFYYNFKSKWALLAAMVAPMLDGISQAADIFLAAPDDEPPDLQLRRGIEEAAALCKANQPIFRSLMENWYAIPELQDLWMRIIENFGTAIAAWIDHLRDIGAAPPGPNSRALSSSVMWSGAQCLYVASLRVDAGLDIDSEDVVASLLALWIGGVFHPTLPQSQ